MCGITGFVSQNLREDEENHRVLKRMCRLIRHRGPDDEGRAIMDGAALGMTRLSIIDLAGGHQPLGGCDGAVTVVFNGEIYNYRELRRQLEGRHHRFRTQSDTEVIVHSYEEYGPACVEQLRGMFAFAIWDARSRTLMLARDRVGKKPLYYSLTPGGALVFASELKSLLAHPEVTRRIDLEALDAYLSFGYVPDPLCIFDRVRKLSPGCYLTFAGQELQQKSYWDFPHAAPDARPAKNYLEELRARLEEAVRLRLVSDVPLGAFLSGGVDSSAVVGLMAQALERPVKTFAVGFEEDGFSELHYARQAARRFRTDHHELVVTPDVGRHVDELVWHLDEPFADSSALPTYLVAKLAREQVKVVLTGDGGDELFAGYTRYLPEHWQSPWERLPRTLRRGVMQTVGRNLPHGAWGRNYIHDVAFDGVERYVENVSCFSQLTKSALYAPDVRTRMPYLEWAPAQFRTRAAQVRNGRVMDSLIYLDCKTYLPGDILTKVDRMTMAVSLEARSPLLDQELIEFVARLPTRLKLHGGETKLVFKEAVRDIVSPEIRARPKQGFAVPLARWLRGELGERLRQTLTERRSRERSYFNQHYIELLFDEHERQRRDHSLKLWALFMLELWHREFFDASPVSRDLEETAPAVLRGAAGGKL